MKLKKLSAVMLSAVIFAGAAPCFNAAADGDLTEKISYSYSAGEGKTYTRDMEKLDRGLVAIKSGDGVYLSWRLLDSEDAMFGSAVSNVEFNIYRDGSQIATVSDKTNYTDTTAGSSYSVAPVINGEEGEVCSAVSVMDDSYFDISVDKPEATMLPKTATFKNANGNSYIAFVDSEGNEVSDWSSSDAVWETAEYSLGDASCGDVDGDGEYEIIVKWDCGTKDNSQTGLTGTVYLDAYKLDGTKLWRIDLGRNIRAGAHYTQFLVYDFDGDGCSEVMCQTAPGSKDGDGNYVTKASHISEISSITDEINTTSYINAGGYVLDGDEYLTVFNGSTGAAEDTIYYPNQRVDVSVWGDTYGNRVDRFTATMAYLDGENPYAVYMRGYYFGSNGQQRQAACAVSFDGSTLACPYSFDTFDAANAYRRYTSSSSYSSDGEYKGVDGYVSGNEKYVGEGNHNCTVADVDNEGKDEVLTGALCYEITDDDILGVKWCTYLQHGDALHIGDYDPTHTGFEFFTVHEDAGTNTLSGTDVTMNYGMSVIDAETGRVMFHQSGSADTGRGVMANVGAGGFYQVWSAKTSQYQADGGDEFTENTSISRASQNFRIYWDGDLYDNLLDGTNITDWNGGSFDTIFNAGIYGCVSINGTKANPALQADLFGDWREEVVYPTSDNTALRVFSTTTPTNYKIKTLMQDPVYRSGVSAEQTAYNQPPHIGFYLDEELFYGEVTGIEVTSLPDKTVYVPGEAFDKTGIVVTASYSDGTTREVKSYTISEYDSDTVGTQTLTVTYRQNTAEFDVTVKEIAGIEITSLPLNTVVYQGGKIDTSGMVVSAEFNDGTSAEVTNYNLVYNTDTVGAQTVTVEYMGKTAEFEITVKESDIAVLNQTFLNSTADSSCTEISLGELYGDFTLEHTVTINSMPASAANDKNSTDGFFVRFMPLNDGTGAGWQIMSNPRGGSNIYWKYGVNRPMQITTSGISTGITYSFKYEFTNVGMGTGATVKLTITDENGDVVGEADNLDLRNMTQSEAHTSLPMGYIQVYNQASSSSDASVTFADARISFTNRILGVDTSNTGSVIRINSASAGTDIYAAKYDASGVLTDINKFTVDDLGGNLKFEADFVPDKVFWWRTNMSPIEMWPE